MPTTTGDYYQTLGVDRSAGQDELQRAYRRLARRFHPDVNQDPGAEETLKRVNEAYSVLSDPKKRARYDRYGDAWRQIPEGYDGPPPGAYDFTGPGAGGSGFRGSGFGDTAFGGARLEDLLGGFFGGGPGAFGGRVPSSDIEAEIELAVEDAYAGGRRRLRLAGPDGERSLEVNIPAGVTDGQRIRLAGHGGFGPGGRRGDLLLTVRLAPHRRYRVSGRDLSVDLPVAPWEAVLGASVPMDTPGGRVDVRVPPGSSSGRRLRLRGRGLPHPRGTAGDLYAEVKIVVPERLTGEQRKLWRRLAESGGVDPRRA